MATLPEMPKPQQLDGDMAQLRVQRLQFENQLEKLSQREFKRDDGSALTNQEQRIVDAQLRTQRELLNSLLSGCDTQILELTKLKVANTQLIEALNEIRDATHRYLFWVPDVNPINFSYPLNVAHDLTRVLSLDTLSQLGGAFMMMVTSRETLIPIFGALLLVIFSISSRKHYHAFLERASSRVGKVTQDEFFLTVRTVFWSILVAMPLPVLWAALGYGLQSARNYPVAEAIGKGDRHAADPVDLHDLRRFRPSARVVHRALPLAGEAGFARHALLQDVDLADRAADHGADHLR